MIFVKARFVEVSRGSQGATSSVEYGLGKVSRGLVWQSSLGEARQARLDEVRFGSRGALG